MKSSRHHLNWIVDAVLFSGFWMASMLDLTGPALHQWLGLAVGILVGYHFLAHWTWIKSVSQRWAGHTLSQARRFYLIDVGLFSGFSLILLTGLGISTWFDLSMGNHAAWHSLHVLATILTLLLIVFKIGAHRRWVVKAGQSILRPAPRPAERTPAPHPVRVAMNRERRDFLNLMGVVSVAALVAAYSALESDYSSAAEGSSATQASSGAAFWIESDLNRSAANHCWANCSRGCSFPGHCRRYVDANQNNYCDLGECA